MQSLGSYHDEFCKLVNFSVFEKSIFSSGSRNDEQVRNDERVINSFYSILFFPTENLYFAVKKTIETNPYLKYYSYLSSVKNVFSFDAFGKMSFFMYVCTKKIKMNDFLTYRGFIGSVTNGDF